MAGQLRIIHGRSAPCSPVVAVLSLHSQNSDAHPMAAAMLLQPASLSRLFPYGRLPSAAWRPFAWLVLLTGLGGALASAFAPGPIGDTSGVYVANPLGLAGPVGDLLRSVAVATMLVSMALFAVAALAVPVRLRRAQSRERQQLKWFTYAIGLAAALVALVSWIYA